MLKKILKFSDKLVRANWYVMKYQMDKVKASAKKRGVTESEVVRNLIDKVL